jgi:uncharacterized protein (TIGR03382 family)
VIALVAGWLAFWGLFLWFCFQAEPLGATIAVVLWVGWLLLRRRLGGAS